MACHILARTPKVLPGTYSEHQACLIVLQRLQTYVPGSRSSINKCRKNPANVFLGKRVPTYIRMGKNKDGVGKMTTTPRTDDSFVSSLLSYYKDTLAYPQCCVTFSACPLFRNIASQSAEQLLMRVK